MSASTSTRAGRARLPPEGLRRRLPPAQPTSSRCSSSPDIEPDPVEHRRLLTFFVAERRLRRDRGGRRARPPLAAPDRPPRPTLAQDECRVVLRRARPNTRPRALQGGRAVHQGAPAIIGRDIVRAGRRPEDVTVREAHFQPARVIAREARTGAAIHVIVEGQVELLNEGSPRGAGAGHAGDRGQFGRAGSRASSRRSPGQTAACDADHALRPGAAAAGDNVLGPASWPKSASPRHHPRYHAGASV